MSKPELNRVVLSLGSNIHPEKNLPSAVKIISGYGRILAASSVWKTLPVGYKEQDPFLNAAVMLETELSARNIYEQLIPSAEQELKRVRDPENKNGPRTIDIDLTLFNSEIFEMNRHQIPDPDLLTRGFVIIPVAELQPGYVHPVVKKRLDFIASEFDSDDLGMILMDKVSLKPFVDSE